MEAFGWATFFLSVSLSLIGTTSNQCLWIILMTVPSLISFLFNLCNWRHKIQRRRKNPQDYKITPIVDIWNVNCSNFLDRFFLVITVFQPPDFGTIWLFWVAASTFCFLQILNVFQNWNRVPFSYYIWQLENFLTKKVDLVVTIPKAARQGS